MSALRYSLLAAVLLGTAALFPACTQAPSGAPLSPLAEKGKQVYLVNCIACHHPSDPSKDGPVGPAIAGSSLELLRARVLEGKYPEGYKPKRESHLMPPLPQLKNDLEALQAYLASFAAPARPDAAAPSR